MYVYVCIYIVYTYTYIYIYTYTLFLIGHCRREKPVIGALIDTLLLSDILQSTP